MLPAGIGERVPAVVLPYKLVPHPINGPDPLWLPGVFFEPLTQPRDVDVDGSSVCNGGIAPDFLKKRFTGPRLARVINEIAEQLKFLRGKTDGLSVAGDLDFDPDRAGVRLRPCRQNPGKFPDRHSWVPSRPIVPYNEYEAFNGECTK